MLVRKKVKQNIVNAVAKWANEYKMVVPNLLLSATRRPSEINSKNPTNL